MRIVILGGTSFVGRSIAEAVLAAGHDVTLANRGKTNASLFAAYRHVVLDRNGDAGALADVDADIVIDTSGYTPDSVLRSARAIGVRARTYVFVSSIDAYDLSAPHISESSATKTLEPGASTSEQSAELYGAHKARCEQLLVDELGASHVLVVRAGLMIGPHDYTDRFTYWPARVARGGEILVPEGREMPVQFIDVRDVAAWVVSAIEGGLHGTFNLVGTPGALHFGDVLDACAAFAAEKPRYHWASSEFLVANDVGPWVEMPLWLPADPALAGLLTIRNDRAWKTGLRLRPLAETVRDILAELRMRSNPDELRAGLSPKRESALLASLGGPAA